MTPARELIGKADMLTGPATFVSYQLSKQVCLIEMTRTQKRPAPTLLAYSFFHPKPRNLSTFGLLITSYVPGRLPSPTQPSVIPSSPKPVISVPFTRLSSYACLYCFFFFFS